MQIDDVKDMTAEDKEKTASILAKVIVHLTDDKFERASRTAVNICFALKYALAMMAYIFIRNFAGLDWGELWMAIVAAFGLYNHELYINFKLKEQMVAEALAEADLKYENGDSNGKEDKDSAESKDVES